MESADNGATRKEVKVLRALSRRVAVNAETYYIRFPAKTMGIGCALALYLVATPNVGPAPRMPHHRSK